MHPNRFPRHHVAPDPAAVERERADQREFARRARLVAQYDAARARVAALADEAARFPHWPAPALAKARDRLAYYTAAAERAGLIHPRKEPAQ